MLFVDLYEALYTTRAMRRVKRDPVPSQVQARILDAAIRAPSGGNAQSWRFLLVDDHAVIARLGPLYRESLAELWQTAYRDRRTAAEADPGSPRSVQFFRMVRSAQYLADHFEDVPLFMFAFAPNALSGGSIFPAVWSAMLAARGLGVGSAITTVLGAYRGNETLEVLGVPQDSGWVNLCCVSFGYPTGRWATASRVPAHKVAFRNQWGAPFEPEIPVPLWPSDEGTG
jgi:nitroreductase